MFGKVLACFVFCSLFAHSEVSIPFPVVIKIPEYPRIAAAAGYSGEVVICYKVDSEGNVVDIVFKSGPKRLFKFAQFGLSGWKFSPVHNVSSTMHEMEIKFIYKLVGDHDEAGFELVYPEKVVIRGRPIKLRND